MVADIISMISIMIANAASWFNDIMAGSGMLGMFLFGFVIYNVFRLLVQPLVGSGSSDSSSKIHARLRDAKQKK